MSRAQPMAFASRQANYLMPGPRKPGDEPELMHLALTPAQQRRIRHKAGRARSHRFTVLAPAGEVAPLRLTADDILRQRVHVKLNEQDRALEKQKRARTPKFFIWDRLARHGR